MSTIELKNILLKKLESADDALLREILALIEFETTKEVYKLSKEESNKVADGLEQIKNGQIISNANVDKEIDEWLSE
jgi:predicted transcriptional regulator